MNSPYRQGRTRVKICGLTRVRDAVTAAYLGADAIGLVFHAESPRQVALETAARIVGALPPFVSSVAVFADEQPARVHAVIERLAVDVLQFHGEETPEFCRSFGRPYVKAVRMCSGVDIALVAKRYGDASALLLDAYHPAAKGGTGQRFDWDGVPSARPLPIILAGGLTPDNVAEAMRSVKPFALDVSSGVEKEKGEKDPDKMAAFIREVQRFDSTDPTNSYTL